MKKQSSNKLNYLSLNTCYNSIDFSNICVLVMDGDKSMTHVDESLANRIYDEGRGIVVILNKGDLVEDRSTAKEQLIEYTNKKFPNV